MEFRATHGGYAALPAFVASFGTMIRIGIEGKNCLLVDVEEDAAGKDGSVAAT